MTYQHNEALALLAAHLAQGHQRVGGDGHVHVLAEMDLALSRAGAGLGLGALDLAEGALLLGEGRLELGVAVVLGEALGAQLLGRGGEDGLAEVLGPQLAHQRQPRRREQHLLADLGRVGHVRDGDEPRRVRVPLQQDVEGLGGLQVRGQRGQVAREVGRGRGERRQRRQGFVFDGDEETEEGVVGQELVELGDQLLRCCRQATE